MLQIMVDNTELKLEISRMRTMAELVEYIKSSIDPDTIILSLTRDELPLSDNDWSVPLTSFGESKVEVMTGSKMEFVQDRLKMSESLVDQIYESFTDLSKLFKHGMEDQAHEPFAHSLNDLNAFVGWLYSVFSVDAELFGDEIIEFEGIVDDLKKICVDIQRYQMQQAWWNIGDVLDLKVISNLEQMKELSNRSLGKLLS
jgi:hypothetical protein